MDFSYAFLNQLMRLCFALVCLPVALATFNASEINIWFLMMAVIALGQSFSSGLSVTVARFLSYTKVGIGMRDFSDVTKAEDKLRSSEIRDQQQLIFWGAKVLYAVVTLIFVVTWILAYVFIFSEYGDPDSTPYDGIIVIVAVLSCCSLYFQQYQATLEGMGLVALVQKIGAAVYALGILLVLALGLFGFTLASLAAAHQVVVLLHFLVIAWANYRRFKFRRVDTKLVVSSGVLFLIFQKARLSSYTAIVSSALKQVPFLVVSAYLSGSTLSNLLITKRLYEILETFASALFTVKNPELSRLFASQNMFDYHHVLRLTCFLSFSFFIVGSVVIVLLSEVLINSFSATEFSPGLTLLLLFGVGNFGARCNAACLSVCNHSNNVKEHWAITMYVLLYVLTIVPLYGAFGLYSFASVMILGGIINLPYTWWAASKYTLRAGSVASRVDF